MRPGTRIATPAVLGMLALLLTSVGCNWSETSEGDIAAQLPEHVKVVRIRVANFDASQIRGIWLYRWNDLEGTYEPSQEIQLDTPVLDGGREYVDYTLFDPSGLALPITPSAEVERDGDDATLALWFVRLGEPGEFRATLYNEAGESGLSEEVILL